MVPEHETSFEVHSIDVSINWMSEIIAEKVMASPNKTLLLESKVVFMKVIFLKDKVNRYHTVSHLVPRNSWNDNADNRVFADEGNHSKDESVCLL